MKGYKTSTGTARRAKLRVEMTFAGEGADEAATQAFERMTKENRRRKHSGDAPIAYSISSEETTSISSQSTRNGSFFLNAWKETEAEAVELVAKLERLHKLINGNFAESNLHVGITYDQEEKKR